MDRRELLKGLAVTPFAPRAADAPAGVQATNATTPPPPERTHPPTPDPARPRFVEDTWPGKKKLLAIADADVWYNRQRNSYHHDSSSHTLATIDRLGRESGDWITIIRTDFKLLTKDINYGRNARTLDDFDAVFFMGGGSWEITDEQKDDLLSFVHDDGKGFIGGHASNGGGCIVWREYAEMVGGDLVAEFPSITLPIVVEDPAFPGLKNVPHEFSFRDQYTILGPNFSRDVDRVILRLDSSRFAERLASLNAEKEGSKMSDEAYRARIAKLIGVRTDGDYPIVWAKKYGKGRVWYSTFGHIDTSLDDPHIQQIYTGGIRWALGLVDADITPRPFPGRPYP